MTPPFSDADWMRHALALARKAQQQGEVPVGAVIVKNDQLIAEGWNQPISSNDPTAHAEIMALRNAATAIHNYRLVDTVMYVTLEPCIMCVGALIHARVSRLVYGTGDTKVGAAGSVFDFLRDSRFNHQVEVQGGVLQQESATLLSDFFRQRRLQKKDPAQ
ncbi:MAG: tRNA adenosine(34) deaminase TadA [Gammaproteobacteria bacterium]|nr:tRNA adenosine(34) deaminase TadA [Gammaproteobacteria bacterium]MDH5801827.1 tRNA adenosine(34) deaminase TadA [Gammaproteobacteria bacterium]